MSNILTGFLRSQPLHLLYLEPVDLMHYKTTSSISKKQCETEMVMKILFLKANFPLMYQASDTSWKERYQNTLFNIHCGFVRKIELNRGNSYNIAVYAIATKIVLLMLCNEFERLNSSKSDILSRSTQELPFLNVVWDVSWCSAIGAGVCGVWGMTKARRKGDMKYFASFLSWISCCFATLLQLQNNFRLSFYDVMIRLTFALVNFYMIAQPFKSDLKRNYLGACAGSVRVLYLRKKRTCNRLQLKVTAFFKKMFKMNQ